MGHTMGTQMYKIVLASPARDVQLICDGSLLTCSETSRVPAKLTQMEKYLLTEADQY